MRLSVKRLTVVLLTAPLIAMWMAPARSAAQIAFSPCGDSNDFACGHLTVPIDPTEVIPGTITLAIRRHRAPVGNGSPASAVVALAGGPGQPAIPFAEAFTETLGPVLSTRDLIVFDQRGIGLSHPLSCHGFEHPGAFHSAGRLIATCASQIGPTRGLYTSPDSVADIEAIRQAGGYEKLVLYGTSYGTKVALEYAQDYPQHVEALILDSVVPANGPEPFDQSTFAAVPRILRQLCTQHDCTHITHNPVSDLARVVQRMRRGPLPGRVIDGHGHPHTVHISSDDLIGILLEGDFNPILRAEFIAAVRAAANGDTAPLARLLARGEAGGEDEPTEDNDVPLYYATTCEEQTFPWSRAASPHERIAQATARADSLPPGSVAPFTVANAIDLSSVKECAFWPFATPAPPVNDAPLPHVPTLLLSGANDLRTPTVDARSVAAQIPGSHLLVVPNTGHSVLGTEPNPCAHEALDAMFAGRQIVRCAATPIPPFARPTPLPPDRLTDVTPTHDYRGRDGRTLHAVSLTLDDFARQLLLQLLETIGSTNTLSPSALDSGGLRAGWAQLTRGAVHLHGYSYIPGVSISGTIKAESITLRVGGFAAAHGTLRLGPHKELVGMLGSQSVHLAESPSTLQAQTARHSEAAPSDRRANSSLERAGREGLATRLADTLRQLPAGLGPQLAVLPRLWAMELGAGIAGARSPWINPRG